MASNVAWHAFDIFDLGVKYISVAEIAFVWIHLRNYRSFVLREGMFQGHKPLRPDELVDEAQVCARDGRRKYTPDFCNHVYETVAS